MTKPKQAEGCGPDSPPRKTDKPAARKRSAPASNNKIFLPDQQGTYQARRLIALLLDAYGCNDRRDNDCYGLAAAFGARLLAGVIRKKLGSILFQNKPTRVESIASRMEASPAAADRAKQAADAQH